MNKFLLFVTVTMSLAISSVGYAEDNSQQLNQVNSSKSDRAKLKASSESDVMEKKETLTKEPSQIIKQPSTQYAPNWLMSQLFLIQSELKRVEANGANKEILHNTDIRLQEAIDRIDTLETTYNSRYEQMSWWATIWGGILAAFGLIVTIAAILLGWSAKNNAINEAKQIALNEAKGTTRKYLDSQVNIHIKEFQSTVASFHSEFKTDIAKSKQVFEKDLETVVNDAKNILLCIEDNHDKSLLLLDKMEDTITPDMKKEMQEKAKAFPESVSEWHTQANAYFYSGDIEKAINSYNKALEMPNITDSDIGFIKLNIAHLYRANKDVKNALVLYQNIIDTYSESSDIELRYFLANALMHKGDILFDEDNYELAMEAFELIINKYSDVNNEYLVVSALNFKAIILGRLERFSESLNVYDYIVKTYKESKSKKITNLVNEAIYNALELSVLFEGEEETISRINFSAKYLKT